VVPSSLFIFITRLRQADSLAYWASERYLVYWIPTTVHNYKTKILAL
jgi:hypothetical protein